MRVDGKEIANKILASLTSGVVALKEKGVTPRLAVIQIGDDPASTAYIRQKQNAADAIGVKIELCHVSRVTCQEELQEIIQKFNKDSSVHGIIVQRPLPAGLRADSILPSKDVDGFLPDSPYEVPVAEAVLTILERSHPAPSRVRPLQKKRIVIIGRGETAGKPIAEYLKKQGIDPIIIHSQTPNPDKIIKATDVVVSCVGKPNVVRRDNIKQGAVLISVGLWRDEAGKLHGDYDEDKIKDVAGFYTPTPGGVGPVNVACLMANLVKAAN